MKVDFVEELGAGRVIHSELDGQPFAACVDEETYVRPGDRIALELPLAHLHVFDRETGRRIELEVEPRSGRNARQVLEAV